MDWFKALPLFLTTILMVSISGCVYDEGFWDYGYYERDIERYYRSEGEYTAILTAESLNYTEYTNFTRWEGEWANFIDKQVIERYNRSYTKAKEEEIEADIYFTYTAAAQFYTEMNLKIRNTRSLLKMQINGGRVLKAYDDELYRDQDVYLEELHLGYMKNNSWNVVVDRYMSYWRELVDIDLDLTFENAYFVGMSLTYDDIWGSLAAIFVNTEQFLVLDSEFNVLLMGIMPSAHMIS